MKSVYYGKVNIGLAHGKYCDAPPTAEQIMIHKQPYCDLEHAQGRILL